MTTTRIILIDISSSMNSSFKGGGRVRRATRLSEDNHKFEAAKQYLLATVANLYFQSPSSSLIIISFAEESSVIYQGSISNSEVINSAVNRLKPDGKSTNLASAFDLAFKILSQSSMPKIRCLDVITDGLSNQGDPVLSARHLQVQKGVFIYLYLIDNTDEGYENALEIIGNEGGRIEVIENGMTLLNVGEQNNLVEQHIATNLAGAENKYKTEKKQIEEKTKHLGRPKFSVVYPEIISYDKWHSLYFFMYNQEILQLVKRKINKLTKITKISGWDYDKHSSIFSSVIPEGSLVEISWFSEEVKVNPEKISFNWFEDFQEFNFRIKCQESKEINEKRNQGLLDYVYLRIDISVNTLPVIFPITLAIAIGNTQNSKRSTIDLGLVETIFASYSEVDYEVVEDFKEKYEVIGISMFTQAISFRNAGVRGQALQELFGIIESSDIFQLFWSSSAQQCEGVKRETAKAIELIQNGKKPDFFRGVYWEEQFPELPAEMVGMPFSKLPWLRDHRKEKADLMKAIEREAARPIANITNTAIAESKSASDSFNIDQSHTVNPSTAIAKNRAKQQVNTSSIRPEPQFMLDQTVNQELLEKESKFASDSFNIAQNNAVTPSTAIAKDQAKQQVNISSVTSEPQCTPQQILVQNLLEKLRQFIKFNPNLSDNQRQKGLEHWKTLVDISKKPIDSDIQDISINKVFTSLRKIIYSGYSVEAGLELINEIATLFDIK
jgi:hypothetical protein